MKSSTLISILAACLATSNAFSLNSLFRQQFLDDSVVVIHDDEPSVHSPSVFEQLTKNIDELTKGAITPEVEQAWKQMQQKLGSKALLKKVDEYNSKANQLINKVKDSSKTFTKAKTDSSFESLSVDKYSDYSLRIKKTNPEILGLDTVKQYTGYLDIDSLDKHFFYWFFESRNDPATDPIILWLNGGPGCSSSTGLFFELGPSSINATLNPVFNPYSWNSNASVIFLDQPVGVGYSYTGGEEISNTAAAGKDVFVFLELFFQKFPQFLENKFHIAGESYAGHYIPKFASEIINRADRSFDLTSVLIGNGITDPVVQAASYKPMACGEGGYRPVLDEDECDQLDKDYPKCAVLGKLCYKFQTAITCVAAQYYCDVKLFQPYASTGLNPYDIRKPCADEGGNCYIEMDYMDDYLNLDYVKEAVGASNIDIFTSCDDKVFRNFLLDGDEAKPHQQYVAELLENDIPVLLYAGDKDYICNWLGNHAWSDVLEYEDHESFQAQPLKPWYTAEKKLAGEVKNYKKFTFLRIYNAGHMVPYDQPAAALDMVNRWVAGDYSFGY
ncbi:Alpha/Beta hydrolase protein [Scheffersomyces coipomensis]|uniref:Alpha/Beta hydrolase protein n=1 Tax=Scheffersomyces coipomensis TaxID=1788519 RepID=UPI00315C731B